MAQCPRERIERRGPEGDPVARGTGEALTKSGLVGSASYENMSGGGGCKAIGYMIENAESLDSTPIVIRSLTGVSRRASAI